MSEIAGQSIWFWVALVVAVLIVVAAIAAAVYFVAFKRLVRRHVVRMVARGENLEASRRALETVVKHLADSDDETLLLFAQDPDSVDRRTFHEVAQRMRMLRDELDHLRLPARVVPLAEQLADSAHVIAQEAGRLHDDMAPDDALEALSAVDLGAIAVHLESTKVILDEACEEYDIQEAAVYGGGLYI